jgi:tetratricopeptide (TPR) repeat protein
LKNNTLKYSVILGFLFFLIACSTKKNNFVSRNSHALSTEYNILYNGGVALEAGIKEVKATYRDNFWELLPIERMQINKEVFLPGQTKNANFERAETKAIKAIQKHSMNIEGSEKNPQMDEAHLMLGKARYYDQRFVPALEAFNYILYKYPNSDKIYEAKVWREKTNIRMNNDALAVNNLRKLLKEIKFKDQIFADANAILSQAFLNLEEKDSAVARLKLATEFTKQKEEKARYRFVLAQLYDELGYKDSAFVAYQSVIDMKRKSPRQYVVHAHAKQAQQFDFEKGDTIAFLKKFNKLLKDRENRPFLDALNHQMGLFYDKNKKYDIAQKYYNKSLKSKSQDAYLIASNYRNLADLYFNKAKYQTAGQYYDSTLVHLNAKSREYKSIRKKRENLVDVIKYEGIATRNDSILNVVSLSETDKINLYQQFIAKLKKEDEIKKALLEKEKIIEEENTGKESDVSVRDDVKETEIAPKISSTMPPGAMVPSVGARESNFYFYNSTTVAFGKTEFRKNWGDRVYKNNWRLSTAKSSSDTKEAVDGNDNEEAEGNAKKDIIQEKYTTGFYLKQLPKTQAAIDSIAKERNFAYYQLGVIYKEKFKEYQLAASKLEKLLKNNPEERLVLPSMYNLYKIYEIIDKDKAQTMKDRISTEYRDSYYAQILNNVNSENPSLSESPEVAYAKLYKLYEAGDYRTVYINVELAINQFSGEEMVSKFELLKSNTVGKLKGLAEYKKTLNFVALTYPYSEEGKQAEVLLGTNIPVLENLKFNTETPKSWKLLYRIDYKDDKGIKILQDKINKFIASRPFDKLTLSNDIYTMDENFVVIHGIISEEYAKGITTILKEYKDYKIIQVPILISNYNYKVVIIKKNLAEYMLPAPAQTPVAVPVPVIDPLQSPILKEDPTPPNPILHPKRP